VAKEPEIMLYSASSTTTTTTTAKIAHVMFSTPLTFLFSILNAVLLIF